MKMGRLLCIPTFTKKSKDKGEYIDWSTKIPTVSNDSNASRSDPPMLQTLKPSVNDGQSQIIDPQPCFEPKEEDRSPENSSGFLTHVLESPKKDACEGNACNPEDDDAHSIISGIAFEVEKLVLVERNQPEEDISGSDSDVISGRGYDQGNMSRLPACDIEYFKGAPVEGEDCRFSAEKLTYGVAGKGYGNDLISDSGYEQDMLCRTSVSMHEDDKAASIEEDGDADTVCRASASIEDDKLFCVIPRMVDEDTASYYMSPPVGVYHSSKSNDGGQREEAVLMDGHVSDPGVYHIKDYECSYGLLPEYQASTNAACWSTVLDINPSSIEGSSIYSHKSSRLRIQSIRPQEDYFPDSYPNDVQNLRTDLELENVLGPECVPSCHEVVLDCTVDIVEQQGKNAGTDAFAMENNTDVSFGHDMMQPEPISVQSSWRRVEEWIHSIEGTYEPLHETSESGVHEHPTREGEKRLHLEPAAHNDSEVEMANAAVRSLNPLSTVAHLTGIGLMVVPNLMVFSHLKYLTLAANTIVKVTPGALPKSLHSLDLSRNKLTVIEGFRDLTRLRVLNLSYNRIARIGHGLANCTSIRELHLGGNKIGEIEGLHRLTKLSYLDISFNRLTTTKSLDQIAAYSSLLALNVSGNAIQMHLGDDRLRRLVCNIAPQILNLNKRPTKQVHGRDAPISAIARYGSPSARMKLVHKSKKSGNSNSVSKVHKKRIGEIRNHVPKSDSFSRMSAKGGQINLLPASRIISNLECSNLPEGSHRRIPHVRSTGTLNDGNI